MRIDGSERGDERRVEEWDGERCKMVRGEVDKENSRRVGARSWVVSVPTCHHGGREEGACCRAGCMPVHATCLQLLAPTGHPINANLLSPISAASRGLIVHQLSAVSMLRTGVLEFKDGMVLSWGRRCCCIYMLRPMQDRHEWGVFLGGLFPDGKLKGTPPHGRKSLRPDRSEKMEASVEHQHHLHLHIAQQPTAHDQPRSRTPQGRDRDERRPVNSIRNRECLSHPKLTLVSVSIGVHQQPPSAGGLST